MSTLSHIWPAGATLNAQGELEFYSRSAQSLLEEFGSPLYVMDCDDIAERAARFHDAAVRAFSTTTVHVSYAGKAFLSKRVVRMMLDAGLYVDTCTMGEMRIALAAGAPGRRLVLHGNNKSDEEIELAIREGFAKIVVDSPDEPARIAAIARRLGLRARVMLRVTAGVHAGGHEYISTAHEDQKFGVPLLPADVNDEILRTIDSVGSTPKADSYRPVQAEVSTQNASLGGVETAAGITPAGANVHIKVQQEIKLENAQREHTCEGTVNAISSRNIPADCEPNVRIRYPYDLDPTSVSDADRELAAAMETIARGPALAVLQAILHEPDALELVGIHSHIGSQIHDAAAFVQAARRMMLLRKTLYATDAYTLPEVDLGGGFSVAYTDGEDSMDVDVELSRLAHAVREVNRELGMPMPIISFEPGRWIVAPTGVSLYRVGTVKEVQLPAGTLDSNGRELKTRTYVSVDGGMSDNIRPALYDATYTARLANRDGATVPPAKVASDELPSGESSSNKIVLNNSPSSTTKSSDDTVSARIVGMHCESGDILVRECQLPADIHRGDILAIPVTGAYGRTMASNYNQALIPAVVGVSSKGASLLMRRQTIEDLLSLDYD